MTADHLFSEHPGYAGVFTKDEVPYAFKNGTRIEKCNAEPGDGNPDGTQGTVLGSVDGGELGIAYFVEWDTMPKHAVLVVSSRIKRVSGT
jgi:hypothetical protein